MFEVCLATGCAFSIVEPGLAAGPREKPEVLHILNHFASFGERNWISTYASCTLLLFTLLYCTLLYFTVFYYNIF